MLANPQFRSIARNVGMSAVRGLGRSRARRAGRGKWYFGRRVGIPPQRQNRRSGGGGGVLYASTSTSAPVARSSRIATNPTSQRYNATGVDWLTDVANTTTLDPSVYSYTVNPAEPSSFPRLANIAAQYQRYELQSLQVVYTPTCATTQKGMLYIAPIRDPTSPLPDTVPAMRGLSGCMSCAVRDPMSVTILKSQMSSALNGFYCEAPTGVEPEEDNALRSCGRIAIMTDGVLKNDGDVGSIIMRYNFILSDPKSAPEGSALSGGLVYTAGFAAGDLDLTDYSAIHGKPAISLLPDGSGIKRSIGPVLIQARGDCAAHDLVLEVDGTPMAALDHHQIGVTTFWISSFWLPPGRQRLQFSSATGYAYLQLVTLATGPVCSMTV